MHTHTHTYSHISGSEAAMERGVVFILDLRDITSDPRYTSHILSVLKDGYPVRVKTVFLVFSGPRTSKTIASIQRMIRYDLDKVCMEEGGYMWWEGPVGRGMIPEANLLLVSFLPLFGSLFPFALSSIILFLISFIFFFKTCTSSALSLCMFRDGQCSRTMVGGGARSQERKVLLSVYVLLTNLLYYS